MYYPDKKRGRSGKLVFTPVKEVAVENDIPVYTPARVKDAEFVEQLRKIPCDVIVVVAFGQILSKEILDYPKFGCINVHASLLPRWRGAAPMQWAILEGDEKTGVTTMQMAEGLDTGDMLLKAETVIEKEDTAETIHDRLSEMGKDLLLETLEKVEKGEIVPQKQDDSLSCYAAKHWEILTAWSNYLAEVGMDPENQLCTEDFAGHLAHNANLSAKAIMAIAGYGRLAEMLNKPEEAKKFTEMAKRMAIEWERRADDGDHYRLAFDMPGTWSQKYNFVWDKVLGFNILPDRIMKKEVAFYLKTQNKYGLPLDNRFTWGKTDDTVWSATMADSEGDFQELIRPIWKYVNETPSRVPLGDWYETLNADYINFRARSVVGGVFMKSLDHYLRNKRK